MAKSKPIKHSKEFLERQELMALQREHDIEKHERAMKELEFRRESENLFHLHEMERQRIKSAEIRKMQDRKANMRFMNDYDKPHN